MSLYTAGSARRSLIDTVSYRVLSQLATLASYVVMVRGMTKHDFGVFNLLYAFIPVVSTVASLGLDQILRRYQPEYLRSGNPAAAAWLLRVVSSARFGTNVMVISVVLLTWNYIAPVFKLTEYRVQFAMFSVLLLLFFQVRVYQLALGSHMLQRYAVGSAFALAVLKLVIYSLFVLLDSLTLERAILADTLGFAVVYLLMRRAYQRDCVKNVPVKSYRPPPEERKRLIRYGLFNNFNDAGVLLLYTTLDNFFIAAFLNPVSVGVYSFYTRLNEMSAGLRPMRLFDNVIQPMFFATSRADAEEKIPRYFTFLVNMNLALQFPILAFAIAYHAEVVQVFFGGKYIEHSWLLPLVTAFSTLNIFGDPATLVAQYEERPGVLLQSKIFVAYNIAAMFVFVPMAGIFGASLASGSAQLMKNAYIWWRVRRRAVWTNAVPALVSGLALWGAVVGVCYGLKELISAPPLVQLIMGATVFVAAGLLNLRGPAISKSDRQILASVLAGRETRILDRLGLMPTVRRAS